MKGNHAPTCSRCWGQGTITETKRGWGADEKGLPIRTEQTTKMSCPDCEGTGTK